MVTGFLELTSSREVRGWAHDSAEPGAHLTIEILCAERTIGRVRADMYRRDLETAGLGQGDHAFVLYCEPPLAEDDLPLVSARVNTPGRPVHILPRLSSTPKPELSFPPIAWPGLTSDTEHRPVFILGAARSGTSAVAHALLAGTRYEGNEEGHLMEVLAPLTASLEHFYAWKTRERAQGANTTAARVPQAFFEDALAEIAITAARALFPSGFWLDKTPNENMVRLAPRFRRIWPNARFIFMKRRGTENVASRLRKFDFDFAHNCREWASIMQAWLTVRGQLAEAALELDQRLMARDPESAAAAIVGLLDLSPTEQRRLARILANERPQQTGDISAEATPLDEMGWSADQVRVFKETCGPMMAAFSYSEEAHGSQSQ